jgi:hypothetical protein
VHQAGPAQAVTSWFALLTLVQQILQYVTRHVMGRDATAMLFSCNTDQVFPSQFVMGFARLALARHYLEVQPKAVPSAVAMASPFRTLHPSLLQRLEE